MRAKEEAFRILESALTQASQGVDEAEVALGGGELGSTRFTQSGVALASEHASETLSIRVMQGGCVARVTTSDFSHDGIRWASDAAKAQVVSFAGIPSERTFPEPHHYAPVEAYDPETEATRALERAAMAARGVLAAKEHGLRARGAVVVKRGGIGFDGQLHLYAVANTRGLLAYHPDTRVHFSIEMTGPGGGYGAASAESCSVERVDADTLVHQALRRALRGGARAPVGSGAHPAVLEPPAVAALLRFLGMTCGAGMAEMGCSFLSGATGDRVAGPGITIQDDFSHDLHRGTPFDTEGVACRPVDLIRDGIVQGPVISWDNARRLQVPATGHHQMSAIAGDYEGARYLVMEGTDASLEDLIDQTGSGVLVPDIAEVRLLDSRPLRVMGMTKPLWRIEGGELVAPAPAMRFEVSLMEVLQRVTGRSSVRLARESVAPGLAVDGFELRPTTTF